MSANEFHDKVWRLIAAAKAAINPERRRTLMNEAFDLIKAAKVMAAQEAVTGAASPSEPKLYRVRLFRDDSVTAWIELPVDNRAEAFWAAEALGAACSEEYKEFGLWQGQTCLYINETRYSRFSVESAREVTLASQLSVLELEESMCRSRMAIGRSQKLLEMTAEMRRFVRDQGPFTRRIG